jgi:uncharacterized protein YkwD
MPSRTRTRPPARAVTAAAALVALPLLASAACGPALASEPLVGPGGQGARSHFAPEVPGAGVEAMTDRLQRALFEVVNQVARARGLSPLVPDARLEAFAGVLARELRSDEVPGIELQEFLLSHYGLGDPLPQLATLNALLDDEDIVAKMRNILPRLMQNRPFARVGIGVHKRWLRSTSVVLAMQRVDVELLPVPRRLDAGGSAMFAGRLLRGFTRPMVLVAPPSGQVRELPVRGGGDSFQTSLRCDAGAGRYQVELMASDTRGKTVLANFPLFCAVEPPRSAPRRVVAAPETTDPARAEALLLEVVNRDRAAASLAPVQPDEALARAARAYSQEMAETQNVDHVSPRSGDARDRVRAAGARVRVVMENVGQANSVAEAQKSFMSSPGHRANVLHPRVSRLGAGVAFRRDGHGVPTMYVTQLFAP